MIAFLIKRCGLVALLALLPRLLPAQAVLFDTVADFSSVQGANNCWYGTGYGAGFSTNGMYYNAPEQNWKNPSYDFAQIRYDGIMHPGSNVDMTHRWSNQVDRFVYFSGSIQCVGGGGDGVIGFVFTGPQDRVAYTHAVDIPGVYGSEATFTSTVAFVRAGEFIDVTLNRKDNYNGDTTIYKVKIHEAPGRNWRLLASSARDYGATQSHTDFSESGSWQYGHYGTPNVPSSFSTANWAYSAGTWARSTQTYLFMYYYGGHPDTYHPVRRWTSDVSGTVNVDATFRRNNTGLVTDGVVFKLFHNDALLQSEAAGAGDNGGHDFQHIVQVAAGDTLDMVVDFNANNWSDGFGSNMTVVRVLPPKGTMFIFR